MSDSGHIAEVSPTDVIAPAKLIQSNFRFMLDHLAFETGLLMLLRNCDVITSYERDRIDPQLTNITTMDGKERLLLTLARKMSKEAFVEFVKCLRETNQNHVADKLMSSGVEDGGRDITGQIASLTVSDSDEAVIKAKVQQHCARITNTIDSFDVRHFLFEKGLISLADYEEIVSLADRRKQCKKLLKILYQVESNRCPFTYLRRALQKRYAELGEVIDSTQLDTSYLDHPMLLHDVAMATGVWGLTVLNGELFVVLHNTNIIQKYKADAPYMHLGEIKVADLGWPTDMVADPSHQCLYISDRYGNPECNADRSHLFAVTPASEFVASLELDVTPGGLSLTSDGRLLVVCENAKINRGLRFYRAVVDGADQKGTRVEELDDHRIQLCCERYILQATEIAKNRFAISQLHKSTNVNRIFVADEDGLEVCSFGGDAKFPHSLKSPWSIYADSAGLIIANDCDNSRIILLRFVADHNGDGQLEYVRDLISKEHASSCGTQSFFPRRLFIDKSRHAMYVGCGCKPTRDGAVQPAEVPAGGVVVPPAQVLGSLSVWRIT